MKTIRFGVVGCGLMGREFGSAAARWCHLTGMEVRPEIVAACDASPELARAFADRFPTVRNVTGDYRVLLADPSVQAVYVAVPHSLHETIYCAAIEAGKPFLGEKPFGIDRKANAAILSALRRNPDLLARCSSESPFFPAMQRIGALIESGQLGRIIEVNSGFLHSSDLDPDKPINWKRKVAENGEYGCMGDLGMHACHVPFRAGWIPLNVRAILSKLVADRPDSKGNRVPCETWDNATLFCETSDREGNAFPMTLKTQRISPGQKNTWYFEVLGTRTSARWSSRQVNTLEILKYSGGEQAWQTLEMGHEMAFPTLTGGIFQAGFSDSILQMWAAFLFELEMGRPLRLFAGCVTPEETALSHALFTAALESHKSGQVVPVA